LTALEILVVRGTASAKGELIDISPVKNLKNLAYLDFSCNKVKDISALRGMPLQTLSCWANPIEDLRPLLGMPLTTLDLNYTYAKDLWPLRNMPLERLHVTTHYASDLTPLANLSLVELQCRFRPQRHPRVLRSIKSLATINDRPVAEFWKDHDDRQTAIETWSKRVAALAGEEQAREVIAKLRELNPGFRQYVGQKIENGEVTELSFQTDNVTDITPVRALSKLRLLGISGSEAVKPYEAKFYDLDPVRDLPIGHLQVANTLVGDLSYLPTKLQVLVCSNAPVRDLRPLRAYPLFYLDCSGTLVDDLSPIKGSGIGHLFVKNARLKDYAPLAGMRIHELDGEFVPARDTEVLRSIQELRKINGKPAAEFWREFQPK
jgi:Leucine-rich repeat (LRR) protein